MQITENGSRHRFEKLTPATRPQDQPRGGRNLRFTPLEHGGEYPDTMPQALKITDRQGRSLIYVPRQTADGRVADGDGLPLAPERRPQDEDMTGRDLAFIPIAWGADSNDDMPEAIAVTDRSRRTCTFEPIRVNGRAVDSKGFTLL